MRIIHVVTLVSRDGSFGGPVAVAVGHVEALAARGHEVRLLAGWDGKAEPPTHRAQSQLFRAHRVAPLPSFSVLTAPRMLSTLSRLIPGADVVHVHLARDLVTLPAALLAIAAGVPTVVQTHGMVMPDRRVLCRVLDAVATRQVLRSASVQLVLTDREERGALELIGGRVNVQRLTNAIESTNLRASWPDGTVPEVLFCARLHPRKRVLAFADMARLLLDQGVVARFTVLGADEGDLVPLLHRVADLGLSGQLTYEGVVSPAAVRARLARGQVYVLPSVDEPFPMTVLEAASVGLPSVITESNGLAAKMAENWPESVTSGSPEGLGQAVKASLRSHDEWSRLAAATHSMSLREFGIDGVLDRLGRIYGTAVGAWPQPSHRPARRRP